MRRARRHHRTAQQTGESFIPAKLIQIIDALRPRQRDTHQIECRRSMEAVAVLDRLGNLVGLDMIQARADQRRPEARHPPVPEGLDHAVGIIQIGHRRIVRLDTFVKPCSLFRDMGKAAAAAGIHVPDHALLALDSHHRAAARVESRCGAWDSYC